MTDVEAIRIRGIRQNNLKGFDLELPLGKLVVVTGLSGAGKSSLVFETLHAEGQRRYVETFSPYTRQFMETLDRPDVEAVENVRPSIAISQGNTVKTSRSCVGTMTELCDYFKVWFCHCAELRDPATGKVVKEETPESVWEDAQANWPEEVLLVTFSVGLPDNLPAETVLEGLLSQGYARVLLDGKGVKTEKLKPEDLDGKDSLRIIQDRIRVKGVNRARFLEAAEWAFKYGKESLAVCSESGGVLGEYQQGLRSNETGQVFKLPSPALFSFNSAVGACPKCRGFGRTIETDYNLVIPDPRKSLKQGAIRAFQGKVYSECQKDLLRSAEENGIPVDVPWEDLSPVHQAFVLDGEKDYIEDNGQWYGVKRFFEWQEGRTYKMHVRVFLSRYRAYVPCPDCGGTRFQPEALYWRWQGKTLPGLYNLPIGDLRELLAPLEEHLLAGRNSPVDLAARAILSRLDYLVQVGVEYLTLNRTSRTLSGGESQRVNLTACLGTALTDTLFVLDEPSIGLHSRDIDRLLGILRRLVDAGNTVVVVEHDEAVMRAADHLLELGPKPGSGGGQLTFSGTYANILQSKDSLTGDYLAGRRDIELPAKRRIANGSGKPYLKVRGASKNNLENLDLDIPLGCLVGVSGVSGSGKSTLLGNVIHQGVLQQLGKSAMDMAPTRELAVVGTEFSEVVLVGQEAVSKTPRSNTALYTKTWEIIRELYARTDAAKIEGYVGSTFSFNSGNGRCQRCEGLGVEKIEMQFLSDIYVKCPDCDGKRFQHEVLEILYEGKNVHEVLGLTVDEAIVFFKKTPGVVNRLKPLEAVGLGYLTLGQPLNTLSGGESQRLKLVKYLNQFGDGDIGALILLDEPTTGLHRHDISKLVDVLQSLVGQGHSVIVIEHQMDVLKSVDWLIEMGPESGGSGGKAVAEGTPDALAQKKILTAPWLQDAILGREEPVLMAAEEGSTFGKGGRRKRDTVRVLGAREHNLCGLDIEIPHRQTTVVTGVSGSGKSTLAFDIIFAEGQRRFLESISSYTRQFVEQLPKPDLDSLEGIAPTVAIEQRVTRGTRKSTVATITEVAHYLRLLYARAGVQYNPRTGNPVGGQSAELLKAKLTNQIAALRSKEPHLYLCAPVIRGRKGHHEPLANWALNHGYKILRIDGEMVNLSAFQKLNRYQEHDIDLVVEDYGKSGCELDNKNPNALEEAVEFSLRLALKQGKGAAFLFNPKTDETVQWYSTTRTDPETGESFPELDPKHFSWNSSKGWCKDCRGFGIMDEDYYQGKGDTAHDIPCPSCGGSRLSELSRAVHLPLGKGTVTLPELLSMDSATLLRTLDTLKLDKRGQAVATDILPQIRERLDFMEEVGLGYLGMDRSTSTLSGGEAQRIRLASQLGANLSGVLYVLDEPTIGLHPRDNDRLLESIHSLKAKGNTILVVEHDETTMRQADKILDLGPRAGIHGGQLLAHGTLDELMETEGSLTGKYLKEGIQHPLHGKRRKLPANWKTTQKTPQWLVLKEARLRNHKGDDLQVPLGRLTTVCGVSGSGKSTLIRDLLHPAIETAIKAKKKMVTGKQVMDTTGLTAADRVSPPLARLYNGNVFKSVIEVDQDPIGKTPRSTPATYLGAFDLIREFFAGLPTSKVRGYTASTFSFNTKNGRCETCKGVGRVKLEMNFLADTYVQCEDCNGRRYGPQLEDICWKGKSLADILDMDFEAAAEFFDFHPRLKEMMELMVETGLGYLTLGQSSPTLSGGEAQRLKLATEIAKGLQNHRERKRGLVPQHFMVLEEPTIGLHLSDCEKLIHMLHRLVDLGHTVVVIEHNPEILAEADYLVEVGPDGGDAGGRILYQGVPEGLLENSSSPTAKYLEGLLR